MGFPDFRTSLPEVNSPLRFDHSDRIVSIGSCFAQNMGHRLQAQKFKLLLNPFGILYNPISIHRCLQKLLSGAPLSKDSLFQHRGLWQHFDFHSQLAHADFSSAFRQMNHAIENGHEELKHCTRLILTFGTAYVYHSNTRGHIVANCHKVAATQFERKRLDEASIVAMLGSTLEQLTTQLPSLQIVLTVSPVRHIKDGFENNQRSKAILLLACETLSQQHANVHYFPAYELLMDDLRDYRFYEKDMLHPNETAQQYIWQHFQKAYFSESTISLNKQITSILKASLHRPLHPEARTELRTFAERQLQKIAQVKNGNTLLDFSKEEGHFTSLLEQKD
ncbi:MAG: GSCFA domain-containing protein [Bacteroidota bacterium]